MAMAKLQFLKTFLLSTSILVFGSSAAYASCPKPETVYLTSEDTSIGKWESIPMHKRGAMGSLNYVEINMMGSSGYIYCTYDDLKNKSLYDFTIEHKFNKAEQKPVPDAPEQWETNMTGDAKRCYATKFECKFHFESSNKISASPFNN